MKTSAKIHCFNTQRGNFAFWEGGLFAPFNGWEVRQLSPDREAFIYRGLNLRPICSMVSRGDYYCDNVIVMRESFFARIVAKFYLFYLWLLPHLAEIEGKIYRVQDGDFLPVYSLTYLSAKVLFFEYKPEVQTNDEKIAAPAESVQSAQTEGAVSVRLERRKNWEKFFNDNDTIEL